MNRTTVFREPPPPGRSRARARLAWMAAGLLLGPGAGALHAQSCDALTNADVIRVAQEVGGVERLQNALYQAYPDAPQTARGYEVFVDGLVGANTRTLTRRFCRDLGLSAEEDAVAPLGRAVSAFAQATMDHPRWRSDVASTEFRAWAREVPPGPRTAYYRVGPDGPEPPGSALLLDAFRAPRRATGAPPGLYVVTDQALESLAAPPEEVRYRVSQESRALLTAAGAPRAVADAVEVLRGLPMATPDSVRAQVQRVVRATLEAAAEEAAAARPPPAGDSAAGGPGPTAVPDVGPRVTRYAAAVQVEEVQPDPALVGAPVSEEVLVRLDALKDIRFPGEELFLQALRVSVGVGASQPALQSRILAAARASGLAAARTGVQVKPIQWDGECGCGTFVKNSDEYPLYLYGMYPFWAAPQAVDSTDTGAAPTTLVDFSLLTRVGYYALTFDDRGAVTDPLHWRKGEYPEDAFFWRQSDFAAFVATAHSHKTEVDVVLHKSDWSGWLPAPGEDSAALARRTDDALTRLQDDIVGLVTPPLDNVLDRIKPAISLGQSPRRTLGDGVTLDLDLSGLTPAEEARLAPSLAELVPDLRRRLRAAGDEEPGLLTDLGRRYFVNLIVPGYCLAGAASGGPAAGCALYSWRALAELGENLDLILVDFTRRPPGSDGAPRPSDLTMAERLDEGLDVLSVEEQITLLEKLLPLTARGSDPATASVQDSVFRYADWHFSGAGMWTLPLEADTALTNSLRAAFIKVPERRAGPVLLEAVRAPFVALDVETRACDFVCPRRWLLRTGVLAVALVLLGLWMASTWWTGLKRIYRKRWVPAAMLIIGLALAATLWCDPYWSERKSSILGLFLGGLMVYMVLAWHAKRREQLYP